MIGPVRSCNVITAMLVLHNIAVQNRDLFEPLPEGVDVQGLDHAGGDNTNEAGQQMRYHYVNTYFS